MSRYFKGEIAGLRELDATLKKLPGQFGERAVLSALRAGAKLVADEARARVPVKSGDLKNSIVIRKPRGHSVKHGARLFLGFLSPTSRRAHLTEFGTRNVAPRPFVRPALEAKGDEAIALIGATMFKKLERGVKKLSGGRLTRRQRREFR